MPTSAISRSKQKRKSLRGLGWLQKDKGSKRGNTVEELATRFKQTKVWLVYVGDATALHRPRDLILAINGPLDFLPYYGTALVSFAQNI